MAKRTTKTIGEENLADHAAEAAAIREKEKRTMTKRPPLSIVDNEPPPQDSDPWDSHETAAEPEEQLTRGQLKTAEDVLNFIFAGNATLTLESKATGNRFTYKVSPPPPNPDGRPSKVKSFVNVLTGPDNERDFRYLGHVFDDQGLTYVHGKKSKIDPTADSAKAFSWFFETVIRRRQMNPKLEVWHEGRCCRCGRKLTVPSSIADGIGPECKGKSTMVAS